MLRTALAAMAAALAALSSGNNTAELTGRGRKIFVAECSECHGARGEKMLETGYRLDEEKLNVEYMRNNIAGRLKEPTTENKEAVELYIRSFNRHFQKEAAEKK